MITREEALNRLTNTLQEMRAFYFDSKHISEDDEKDLESMEMAIKALEQEPCEDAVSRKAVIETLDDMDNVLDEDRTVENYKELLKECYEVLPSVNPQKIGHWVRWYEQKEHEWYTENIPHCKCSECSKEYDPHSSQFINYCPNCNAMMVDPQESEE